MKRFAFYLSLVLAVLVLASCKSDGKSVITPNSSGRPYEVLVVADDNCWMSPDSALFHVLDTDVPGLPSRSGLSVFRGYVLLSTTVRCACSVISLSSISILPHIRRLSSSSHATCTLRRR